MITIKLLGGMCNQMFQRAYGLALESRGYRVAFDRSALVEGTHREYSLDVFGNLSFGPSTGPIVDECGLQFKPGLLRPPDGSTMVGYWQSEKYFADISAYVRSTFHFRHFPCVARHRRMLSESGIFVHMRRQDYVGMQHFHGMPSLDYYTSSVEYIRSTTGARNVFVFSDDHQWCKENFPKDYVVIEDTNKYEDLNLMASCKHAVLANSSFSWWGAWLGDMQPGRVVVAPARWFADPTMYDVDIVPERWLRR